jgi:hypothetical protein
MRRRLGIAIVFVGALSLPLPAAVLVVKPDGTADHTEIQPAIEAEEGDGLVLVHPGTYRVTSPLGFQGKAVTVLAVAGPDVTEIRPADGAVLESVVFFAQKGTSSSQSARRSSSLAIPLGIRHQRLAESLRKRWWDQGPLLAGSTTFSAKVVCRKEPLPVDMVSVSRRALRWSSMTEPLPDRRWGCR